MSPVASLLAALVAHRTSNPGSDERPLARDLASRLAAVDADDVAVTEVPRSHAPGAYVYARFGQPRVLVNVHFDTVPANAGWTTDPWTLRTEGDHLVGLGAADTKGAISAVLTALARERPRDVGILFSGDEEHGNRCIRHFLSSDHARGLEQAIVCEPTELRVGTCHRGIVGMSAGMSTEGGHSSRADALRALVPELGALAAALARWGRERREQGPPGFKGYCMNVARLEGGVAFNVVPTHAVLEFSVRPPPGADNAALRAELAALCLEAVSDATIETLLDNGSFQTRDRASFVPWLGARAQQPVDLGFWTEAALLSAAGLDAVVCGPGSIDVAHAPDEYVTTAQLDEATEMFASMFRKTRTET